MIRSIFVGNLPFKASEQDLQSLFQSYGDVHGVKVVIDRVTGRPRGFAFVDMEAPDAEAAVQALDGHALMGRNLRVNLAQDKRSRNRGLFRRGHRHGNGRGNRLDAGSS